MVCSHGTDVATIFAAINGLHWIQCEYSHCAAVAAAVSVAAVPHKVGSEPILCGCGSGIMTEVQIVVHQNHSIFPIFGYFEIKIQIYLMYIF